MLATSAAPSGKTTNGGTGQTTASPATVAAPVGAVVPFQRASYLHRESTGYDVTSTVTSSQVTPANIPIPAYGFLRSILLKVSITTTGGTPSLAVDGPWNILSGVTLKEPNGNPIVQLDGYPLYLVNKYGGFRGSNDPKLWQGYVPTATAVVFFLRVPLELNVRDAIGSLPNQNSAAQFAISYQLNPIATAYSATTPPTSLSVRVQAWAEEWDQPQATTLGQANETAPDALNTTMFHTMQIYPVVSGNNQIQLSRVGNYMRNLILVTRDVSGVRQSTIIPPLLQINLDSNTLDIIDSSVFILQMSERTGYFGTLDTAGALDTGVYVYDFAHDFTGRIGFETRNQWLYTVSSTRFQLQGVFGAAGQLQVITNDVVLSDNVFVG